MALSVLFLDKHKGKKDGRDITKADRNGLEARIRNGTISFIYRFYLKGEKTRQKMTLGRYPEMSLKEARQLRDKYARLVEEGHDPRKKRKAEVMTNRSAPTLDQLFNNWYQVAGQKKKTAKQHLRSYEIHIQPKFGDMIYSDISVTAMANHLIEKAKHSPGIVDRLMADLRAVIKHANIIGLLDNEPNMFMQFNRKSLGIVRKRGKRKLTANEIMVFYRALRQHRMNEKNKAIIELLLFYGCRGAEVRLTERSWLDWEKMRWTVPAEKHKTGYRAGQQVGDELTRPIIKEVEHLWRTLEQFSTGKYLCTAMKTKIEPTTRLLSAGALQSIAAQIEEHAGKFTDEDGNPYYWEHWTNHDLRRTARTFWGNFGEWVVCEKMLGHAIPGEADVYDLAEYTEKMETIYRFWWKILKRLEAQDKALADLIDDGQWKQAKQRIEPDSNVVSLQAV